MIRHFKPPATGLSYFVGTVEGKTPDLPIQCWYEIDENGSCLRQVELFPDGRTKRDAVSFYPGGATEFGFGTLHGLPFWGLEWDEEVQRSSESEFETAWTNAA